MDSSTKRKVGAIALIIAGIGAFLVPFLLHGPALQASSNGGGNNNNNNGKTPGSTCTTNCSPSPNPPPCTTNCSPNPNPPPCTTNCSPGTSPPPCAADDPAGPRGHTNEGLHLAKGHDKQLTHTPLVGKALGFWGALGKHNPQHDATHSTKTDNDTANTNGIHSNANDNDNSDACTDDDRGNNA